MNSRRTRLRSTIAAFLTILILVPAGVLFARVWRDNGDRRDSTALEQKGVRYLTTLAPLVSALVEYESSALQGVTEPPDSLKSAVSRVADADAQLGDALRTKERWANLNGKIGKLAKTTGNPLAVLQSHIEVTDLTLALYASVRRTSQLNRDPDNDIANLQQATAIDMPTTMVLVSRAGDFANILQSTTGKDRAALTVQFGQGVLAVQDAVDNLTDNLQAAVDDTASTTLSGSLVSTLDAFRRGVESMTRGANAGGTPNVATMSTAQSSLQTALSSLSGVTLKEMGRLLDERIDTLDYRRNEAVAMAGLAVLLVLAAMIWPATGRRREPEPAAGGRPGDGSTREVARNLPAGGPGSHPYGQAPGHGAVDPTQRERSGALR